MNNRRLLTGLFTATLLSGGVCAFGQARRVVSLEELFTAADKSVQLRPSFTAEEEALQDIKVAKSSRLPDIKANISLSYLGDGFTTRRNFSDYQAAPIPHFGNSLSVNVTQPVYSGGAITNGIRLSELKLSASRFATDLQRDNIRFTLTDLYLDIYKYSNLKSVVENNITLAEKLLTEMKSRYELGVALKNDITRYELLVSDLKLQLVKIDNTLSILNRNLVVTAGLPDNTEIIPDSTILDRSLPVAGETWWQKEAEINSPALRLADSEVEINRTAQAIVKSEKLPKVGLQAGYTLEGPILVEVPPINRNLSYWFVGVGVSYNLSSLFKTDKRQKKSEIATRLASEKLDAARENLQLAVRTDYIRYMEAYEDLTTQNKNVELAETNYRTVATRYTEGMALITDMLDATNAKLDAEKRLVNSRINIIYCYYKLLFSSGKI